MPADPDTVGMTHNIGGVSDQAAGYCEHRGGTTYPFAVPNATASAVYSLINPVARNNASNKTIALTLAAAFIKKCLGSLFTLTAASAVLK